MVIESYVGNSLNFSSGSLVNTLWDGIDTQIHRPLHSRFQRLYQTS